MTFEVAMLLLIGGATLSLCGIHMLLDGLVSEAFERPVRGRKR